MIWEWGIQHKILKVDSVGLACHLALFLVSIIYGVGNPSTKGDLPSMKSKLDLTPFGVGAPTRNMVSFHYS